MENEMSIEEIRTLLKSIYDRQGMTSEEYQILLNDTYDKRRYKSSEIRTLLESIYDRQGMTDSEYCLLLRDLHKRKSMTDEEFYTFFKEMYETEMEKYREKQKQALEDVKNIIFDSSSDEDYDDSFIIDDSVIVSTKEKIREQNLFIGETIALTLNADSWCDIRNRIANIDLFSDIEKCLLHTICAAKLYLNNKGIYCSDEDKNNFNKDIEKLQGLRDYLRKYEFQRTTCNSQLYDLAHELVVKHAKRIGIGRHKGSGKYHFIYNDKEYTTIQSCANDYGISKQAMWKKLVKLKIIDTQKKSEKKR